MGNKMKWTTTRLLSIGLLLPLAGGFGFAADEVDHALTGRDMMRSLSVPGSDAVVCLWEEIDANGDRVPTYSISLDGSTVNTRRPVAPSIRLKYAAFDPLTFEPEIQPVLRAGAENRLFLMQFQTMMIRPYREALEARGVSLLKFVADQAFVVEMDAESLAEVESLPFVRWVGAMHPAYKLDPELIPQVFPPSYGEADAALATNAGEDQVGEALGFNPVRNGGAANDVIEYSIMMTRRGPAPQEVVADRIEALGGTVLQTIPQGFRIRATLTPGQLATVLQMNEVLYVDEQGLQEDDMDIAREIGGANYLENELGITGQGVRAEVMDGGLLVSHEQFEGEVIVHEQNSGSASHGTPTFGIVFASGTGDAQARGMIPDADGKIFCDYDLVLNQSQNRYRLTAELVDPNGPYRAVFQSNSWGNSRTRLYTTVSAEMDDISFLNDIIICQSQSNSGNQDSRPQAWAKNIVSVGGVYHRNTLDKSDDAWSGGGSTGPASDGRIKPDLTHFYDNIYTTSSSCNTCYTSSFGGTSGATPITAGHFGLMFQMWHEGVFPGRGGGADVFDSRPAMATAKALMVNSAAQYEFSGTNHDLSRAKQGWGMADLRYLYDHSTSMLVVDQDVQLEEFESQVYQIDVGLRSSSLKVTMVFPDPMGDPNAQVARINDLSLKVTAPDNTVYWGNNDMLASMFTPPGGSANTVDTVENVFLESPLVGTWTVEVIASEINEDGYLATPEIDATFALVASVGGEVPMALETTRFVAGVSGDASVTHATPGELVAFIYSLAGSGSTFIPQLDVTIDLANPKLAGTRIADQTGFALLRKRIPPGTQGTRIWMQAAEFQRKSNVVEQVIE